MMKSRDFRVLFLHEWESKNNAAATARNINAAFGNGSVNKGTIRRWYVKFEIWKKKKSHKRRQGQTRIIVDSEKFYEQWLKKIRAILSEIMQKLVCFLKPFHVI